MVLIAQIALGVVIGGLTLALMITGFIIWMQGNKEKERLAIWLFAAGVVIVVMLLLAGLSTAQASELTGTLRWRAKAW